MTIGNTANRPAVSSLVASKLRDLIENERIVEARELLSKAIKEHGESPELLTFRTVLAPPEATTLDIQDVDRRQELQWIAANRQAYRGRWVAVRGNRLVADAASFGELQRRISEVACDAPPLVHRVQ
jgi:hypothetical protein